LVLDLLVCSFVADISKRPLRIPTGTSVPVLVLNCTAASKRPAGVSLYPPSLRKWNRFSLEEATGRGRQGSNGAAAAAPSHMQHE
jgi:hypothetical protein